MLPPLTLQRTVRHQLLVLEAAREAVRSLSLPRERTMVVIGTGVDPEVARAGARWRVPYWLERAGGVPGTSTVSAQDAFGPPMNAEGVVGTLPNLVANRISTQLDLAGPGFAVSAEEASGLVALEVAARAIRAGEADAALVGATDLSCEEVHRAALRELGCEGEPGDAAVVLVLKPLDAAREDGDPVIALLDEESGDGMSEAGESGAEQSGAAASGPSGPPDLVVGDGPDAVFDPASAFGRAHAASGLVSVAVAALALRHRAVPRPDGPADTAALPLTARAGVTPLDGPAASVRLRAGDPLPWLRGPAPRLHVYSGTDRRGCWPHWSPARSPVRDRPGWRWWSTVTRRCRPAERRPGGGWRRAGSGRPTWCTGTARSRGGPRSCTPTARPPTRGWAMS